MDSLMMKITYNMDLQTSLMLAAMHVCEHYREGEQAYLPSAIRRLADVLDRVVQEADVSTENMIDNGAEEAS